MASTRRSRPTRVEAVFDVEASEALSEVQKRRVIARAGPVCRAVAQDERSQSRNRELAVERLVEKLRAALAVPREGRDRTRPSTGTRAPVDREEATREDEAATPPARRG